MGKRWEGVVVRNLMVIKGLGRTGFLSQLGKEKKSCMCVCVCALHDSVYLHVCACVCECVYPLGPLLYHYSDMPGELSIELSWEDILRVARDKIGFEILVSPPEKLQD